MGMDLLSNHGYERFSLRTWHECLKCAIEFGFQTVTDRDARALAEALLRAIAALSAQAEVRARRARFRAIPAHQVDPAQLECDRAREGLFQEEDKQISWIRRLRGLADFALKGGFVIT